MNHRNKVTFFNSNPPKSFGNSCTKGQVEESKQQFLIPNHCFIAIYLNYVSKQFEHTIFFKNDRNFKHTCTHTHIQTQAQCRKTGVEIQTVTFCTQSTTWIMIFMQHVNGCKHQQSFAITVCMITFSNIQSHTSIKILISDPWKWVFWPFIRTPCPSGALYVKYPADYLHRSDYLCCSQI